MTDLVALLRHPDASLDGLTLDGDSARAQLGINALAEHAQTLKGQKVAVYLRISDDKLEDESGVRRQAIDTIRHVLARGAALVVIYEENDTSAYKKKRIWRSDSEGYRFAVYRVIRPRWQTMLSALRRAELTSVAVANIDRLARDPRDLEDAIELAEFYRRRFEGATGSLDLNTDDGRAMARVMVAMANKASADTARRTRRKHAELAEAGIPVGSYRPFGWQKDRRTLHPVESAELVAAIDRMIAGVTPSGIMADWRLRNVLTTPGNHWRWSPFMSMLRNPRLCGMRSKMVREQDEQGRLHDHWEIVKKADGSEVKGQWEPVVDRAKWDALIEKIGTQSTKDHEHEPGVRKYLLGGLVRCGKCTDLPKMSGCKSHINGGLNYRYQCDSKAEGGCGGNARNMQKVDELIIELVLRYHDQLKATGEVVRKAPVDTKRLDDIEELLGDLYAQWKAKELPSTEYFSMRKDLAAERDELKTQAALAEEAATTAGQVLDVRDRWEDATMAERRAFIERYLEAVIIRPIEPTWNAKARKMTRPKAFNEDLIDPIWRTAA